jgi:hypothetical protein
MLINGDNVAAPAIIVRLGLQAALRSLSIFLGPGFRQNKPKSIEWIDRPLSFPS